MTGTTDILGEVENNLFCLFVCFYFAYISFGYDNLLQVYAYLGPWPQGHLYYRKQNVFFRGPAIYVTLVSASYCATSFSLRTGLRKLVLL